MHCLLIEGVPKTINFNVGYYEGSQQAKVWLVVADVLKRMYQQYPRGALWCDARCQEDDVELNSRKRKIQTRAGSKTLMKMSGMLIKLSRNY